MHLKLSTSAFLDELQTAARVASTRSAVQALSGVQIHAAEGGAELRATDIERRRSGIAGASAARCDSLVTRARGQRDAPSRRAGRRDHLGRRDVSPADA